MLMAAPQPSRGPLAGRVIVVDPGHGGMDSGARAGTLYESDVVLAISKDIAAALRAQGANVVLSRTSKENLKEKSDIGNLQRTNLAARVALAERVKADLFLSIHANRYPSYPSAHGAQVFLGETPSPEQQRLAENLMAELGPLTDSQRMIDGKRPLYLMRHLKVTAALIEVGFLSNPREVSLMTQPEYQRKLGEAVARGVVSYYRTAPVPAPAPKKPPNKIQPQPGPAKRRIAPQVPLTRPYMSPTHA
jgi:N-acetylmuramoyl-L-alanine amidase